MSSLWNFGLLRILGNDAAILYAMLYRVWNILAGVVSILIISMYLPKEMQGYYYTFLSLVALQAFLELGLYVVIVNVASHEWSGLSLDENRKISGDMDNLSRLVSLGRGICKWYGAVSVLYIIVVGFIGIIFFPHATREVWVVPWCFLVLFSGMNLFTLPMISLLEGCGQVKQVNRFRLTQAIFSSLVLWITMYSGANLWALVASTFMVVMRDAYLLLVYYRPFFEPFWSPVISNRIDWREEIWPMQWRLALQAIAGYFLLQLITPVIFHYYGAVAAGRIGMSMQIVGAIQSLGQAWLLTKAPLFGAFIAKGDYQELSLMWRKSAIHSVSVVLVAGMGLVVSVFIGNTLNLKLVDRVVSSWQFALLVLAQVFSQVIQAEAAYLRAFKEEHFHVVGVTGGIIAGVLIWSLGSSNGITGAITGYTISMAIVLVWATRIFLYKKRPGW